MCLLYIFIQMLEISFLCSILFTLLYHALIYDQHFNVNKTKFVFNFKIKPL